MSILIFDIEISGHHTEYLLHLMKFIKKYKDPAEYVFIVSPLFKDFIKNKIEDDGFVSELNIIQISKDEYFYVNKNAYIWRSIKTYKLIKKYALRYMVSDIFVMSINILIFSLIIYRGACSISGIMFAQFLRMEKTGIKNKIKYIRKYVQTFLLTLNKGVRNIYLLNDEESCENLNMKYKTRIFRYLPDPIQNIDPIMGYNVRAEYGVNEKKKIFLHFGSLSIRKGTLGILDSIPKINKDILSDILFFFVGVPDKSIAGFLSEKIEYYKKNYSAQIISDYSYVSDSKMKSLFDQADVVLMPYKNIESSSGVLGLAAASGKIVIGPKKGLVGDLIKKYNLGFTLEEINPDSIGFAINRLFDCDLLDSKFIDYVEERSVDVFCGAILL